MAGMARRLLTERVRAELRAEAVRIANDPQDRAEVVAVRAQLGELRAGSRDAAITEGAQLEPHDQAS